MAKVGRPSDPRRLVYAQMVRENPTSRFVRRISFNRANQLDACADDDARRLLLRGVASRATGTRAQLDACADDDARRLLLRGVASRTAGSRAIKEH